MLCNKPYRINIPLLVGPPAADEELVLQQDGEEEEDHALSGHGEQVLANKVPLQGVHLLLGPWGKKDIQLV